jgi:hypothetical protein
MEVSFACLRESTPAATALDPTVFSPHISGGSRWWANSCRQPGGPKRKIADALMVSSDGFH